MRLALAAILLAAQGGLVFGQLTMDQKITDFEYMAGVFAKRYGPYDWKRTAFRYDALDIAPWLDKVRASKDDLDFYEVMVDYVASLNDAHDGFFLPSNFLAQLHFFVDIYDGKLLVDSINRTRLPASEFGFATGWELVSIDGEDANKLLDRLLRYSVAANERSTRRLTAELLTFRPQQLIPRAADVPETGVVVFRRPDGKLETYRIPWAKSGVPLVSVGRYPKPATAQALGRDDEGTPDETPEYMRPLIKFANCRVRDRAVVGFGSVFPVFAASMPLGFVQRLGRSSLDPFYTGVFESGGYRIGYIRIPSFAPSVGTGTGLNLFSSEIAFMQANTDGLVVDVTRNPGGSVLYTNQLLSWLMSRPWDSIGFEVRATSDWIVAISSAYEQAKALGAPANILSLYEGIRDQLVAANRQARGTTLPIPLDDVKIDRPAAVDGRGNPIGYQKPLMVLIDEMSASGAEYFAATIQDLNRGILFGNRTMGAGGNVANYSAGSYSLGIVSLTESLMSRKTEVVTPDYPTAPYVENIGVRPDIEYDYMTQNNLVNNGKGYVDAWVAAIVDHIRKNR